MNVRSDPRNVLEQFTQDILKMWETEYKTGRLSVAVE
jgi:hypothetical protein